MDVSLYVGLSHQIGMRRNLEIIANNMANMNTTGFKKEGLLFQEYMMRMDGTDTPVAKNVSYVQDKSLIRDFTEGNFRQTDNPLDLALDGQNFFQVQDANGAMRYTRNGHFKLSDTGELTTSNGLTVLDTNGSPITFAIDDQDITISEDGTVSTQARGVIGRIAVVEFGALGQLQKVGDSLYSSPTPGTPSVSYKVTSGMIEDSNVQPIVEMTNLMNVSRQYQSVARILEDQQELQLKSINRLARVG